MIGGAKASPSAIAGSTIWTAALDRTSRRPDEQRVEQQEPGDIRPLQPRVQTAGEWHERQQHAEDQNEQQRPKEFRHRHQQGGAGLGNRLELCGRGARTAASRRTGRAWRRQHGDSWRVRWSPAAWRPPDGRTSRRRWMERPKSPCNAWPSQIAYCSGSGRSRPMCAARAFDFVARGVGRHRHRRRIDRQHAQGGEQQDGDDEQNRHRHQQAPKDGRQQAHAWRDWFRSSSWSGARSSRCRRW